MMRFHIAAETNNGCTVKIGNKQLEVFASRSELTRYRAGFGAIQTLLPRATPDQREFLISGITPAEWDELFEDE